MNFKDKYNQFKERINGELENLVVIDECPEKTVYEAMKYSLMAGGKRLRPVLSLAVCELLNGNDNCVIQYACAIEMIHTYSLIHDDLPAMDNDDYRRGRLTNHKVFGEAVAILAGDALLNRAFETMLEDSGKDCADPKRQREAMKIVVQASGAFGMVGGQVIDMESERKRISQDLLKRMYRMKTGALIRASVLAPVVLCGVSGRKFNLLEQFAQKIGLAFQIKDDILDVKGSFEQMGKKTGKDSENDKTTFVTIYGIRDSERFLTEISEEAENCIKEFGQRSAFLKKLVHYLVDRVN